MRLKFEIFIDDWSSKNYGLSSSFTDGNGVTSTTWWSGPPENISHVEKEYLQRRFSNVKNDRHAEFIKTQYNEQIKLFEKSEAGQYKPKDTHITDYQFGKLRHAFGLGYHNKPYRNYYHCPEDNPEWEDMVCKGLATKRIYGPREVVYFGTLKGLRRVFRENVTQKYFEKINS